MFFSNSNLVKVLLCGLILVAGWERFVYSHDWNVICRSYMWIFKDYARKDIDPPPIPCSSFYSYKKMDVYNIFGYFNKRPALILLWEFKDLKDFDLDKIEIKQNVDLSDAEPWPAFGFDPDTTRPVSIRYGFKFENRITINLDGDSRIDGTFSGKNYKGFYGNLHTMSFSNDYNRNEIVFNYIDKPNERVPSSVVLVLYKGHGSFYLILFNSSLPFKDASIINILNLE